MDEFKNLSSYIHRARSKATVMFRSTIKLFLVPKLIKTLKNVWGSSYHQQRLKFYFCVLNCPPWYKMDAFWFLVKRFILPSVREVQTLVVMRSLLVHTHLWVTYITVSEKRSISDHQHINCHSDSPEVRIDYIGYLNILTRLFSKSTFGGKSCTRLTN